jgi:hypothetical protein
MAPALTGSNARYLLSRYASLTLSRSIQLLVLLPAAMRPPTWRSCAPSSAGRAARRPHDPGSNLPIGRRSPRSAACCPRARWSCLSVRPERLAPAAGRRRLDLPAPRSRTTATGPGAAAADRPLGLRGSSSPGGRSATVRGDRTPRRPAPAEQPPDAGSGYRTTDQTPDPRTHRRQPATAGTAAVLTSGNRTAARQPDGRAAEADTCKQPVTAVSITADQASNLMGLRQRTR